MSLAFEKTRSDPQTRCGKDIRASLHDAVQRFAIAASFVIVAVSIAIL